MVIRIGDRFFPFYDGGYTLVQYYPDKRGQQQFGTPVVLSEETSKCVQAAYEFQRKNAVLFGEKLQEESLATLLTDENPLVAVAAARQLAKAKRLRGKTLSAVLDGPADIRRPIAFYLVFRNREGDASYSLHKESDAYVPPEITSAIKNTDAKTLRLYIAALTVACDATGGTANIRTAMKFCRDRAMKLTFDKETREELDVDITNLKLPSLDSE